MNEASLRNLTGVILILTPVAFNVFFTLLTVTFEYPDILREPTDRILRQFDAGGGGLVAIWYGFMLTAVLFVAVAVLVHRVLARQDTPYMTVATTFGVVGGGENLGYLITSLWTVLVALAMFGSPLPFRRWLAS